MKLRLRPTLFFVIGIGCTVYQLRSELFPWTLLRSSAQYTNNRRLSLFRSNHLSTVTHRVLKSAAGTLCTEANTRYDVGAASSSPSSVPPSQRRGGPKPPPYRPKKLSFPVTATGKIDLQLSHKPDQSMAKDSQLHAESQPPETRSRHESPRPIAVLPGSPPSSKPIGTLFVCF